MAVNATVEKDKLGLLIELVRLLEDERVRNLTLGQPDTDYDYHTTRCSATAKACENTMNLTRRTRMNRERMSKIVALLREEIGEVPEGFQYHGQDFRERAEGWVESAVEQLEDEIEHFNEHGESDCDEDTEPADLKCLECGEPLNAYHHPGCGKRVVGAPTVVQDDCIDEDEEDTDDMDDPREFAG